MKIKKNLHLILTKINNFFEKNFSPIIFFLVFLTYSPFASIISWGGDYGGYILQSEAMFGNSGRSFIEKQNFLKQLSINPRYAIYAPIGLPLLIGITSIFTNYQIYLIKLLIPFSVLISALILRNSISKNFYFFILMWVIHPSITDQYTDILGEIPAILFFILGISTKNYFFKNLSFLICSLIKPTFLIFITIEIIFSSKQKIKDISFFSITLLVSQLISRTLFSMQIFGDYSQVNTAGVKEGLITRFIGNFFELTFHRAIFFLEELGLVIIGFSNFINPLVGILFILFLIYLRNKYSLMIIFFLLFHFLVVEADYFARYLIPILFITLLAINEFFLNKKFKTHIFIYLFPIFLSFFLLQNIYSILNSDLQRGPHELSSIELFEFTESFDDNSIFSFHSPRPFRLFTKKDAYILDGNLLENTVIICYKNQSCKTEDGYKLVFQNKDYMVFDK
jgi:hypothetical protein